MLNVLQKERIKTVILVVLFISTVLLSYFYWQGVSFSGIKESVNEHFLSSVFNKKGIPSESELICPKTVQINYGDNTYSVFQDKSDELWDYFLENCLKLSESDDISVEEITQELWDETMDMKSIQYTFGYNVPAKLLNIEISFGNDLSEAINSVSIIAISEASKSSIFFKDAIQNKYFRIVSNYNVFNIKNKISELKKERNNQYYPIYMILGTDNTAMSPYISKIDIPEISIPSESKNIVKTYEKNIAETFFGQSLDFVRKITDDNDKITYMYGLGEKILNIYDNGFFEYQQETTLNNENTDIEKAFYTAINFISSHGSWFSYDGKNIVSRLSDVSIGYNSKKETYKFTFDENCRNYQLYNSQISKIIIEITGNTVTYYSRNIQIHSPYEIKNTEEDHTQNESIMNILSYNYKTVGRILYNKSIIENSYSDMELFDIIIENITSIDCGYFGYFTDDNNQYFKPAWVIGFNEIKIFFDLYSGEYLGYI